jgi:gamma-glutamylaminecyclotransferase
MAATVRLFVYGTLKRGGPYHQWLSGQRFLGPARTRPHYRLYDCGTFPGLVRDQDAGVAVEGELWEVDEAVMERLDRLEEVPDLFVRGEIELDGNLAPGVTYFYRGDVSRYRDCGGIWPPAAGPVTSPEAP